MTTTLHLMVGLPAAGKTTRARELARTHRALRLTPDEWMIPLFGDSDGGGRRDVLEGRLITMALSVLRVGTSVVLDLGCWSRDERSAVQALTLDAGADYQMVHLPVDPATQWERIRRRWSETPDLTFPMTPADLTRWRSVFAEPDAAERGGTGVPDVPTPWSSWSDWAIDRWPSLVIDD